MRTTLLAILLVCMQLHSLAQSTFEEQIATASQTIADGLNQKLKKKVAVTEFRDLDGGESLLGKYIADEVGINLVNYAETYELIERTRLDALLKEQKLSAEAIINDSTRAEIGRIYGVEAIVIGTITVFETELRLTMRAIDTETGSLLKVAAENVPVNNKIRTLLGTKPTVEPSSTEKSKGQGNNASVGVNTARKAHDTECGPKSNGDICMTNNSQFDVVRVWSNGSFSGLEIRKGETQCFYGEPAKANTYRFAYKYVDEYGKEKQVSDREIQIAIDKCVSKDYEIK